MPLSVLMGLPCYSTISCAATAAVYSSYISRASATKTSSKPVTVRKYNVLYHFVSEQSTRESLATISPQMLIDMHILRAEKTWMDIDQANIDRWHEENKIPNTNA